MPGQCPNVKEGGEVRFIGWQLSTEARMNAGDNYNRPKVSHFTL
jgi:hypothetical protein